IAPGGLVGAVPPDDTTFVQRLDTKPDVPSERRTSCQLGTEPVSSACWPGVSDPTWALCADALVRTMTRVVTSGRGTTTSASAVEAKNGPIARSTPRRGSKARRNCVVVSLSSGETPTGPA